MLGVGSLLFLVWCACVCRHPKGYVEIRECFEAGSHLTPFVFLVAILLQHAFTFRYVPREAIASSFLLGF